MLVIRYVHDSPRPCYRTYHGGHIVLILLTRYLGPSISYV